MSRLGKILYLIAGLSLLSFLAVRFIIGGFVGALWVPLIMFLLGVFGALFVDRKLYFDFLSMKTTKHGMSMGATIGCLLVFLAAVNFVSIRHYKAFDVTQGEINSLADQSVRLAKSLESELKVTFFFDEASVQGQQNRAIFQKLIKRYQDVSAKINLDFVEVNKRPDLAEQYGVRKGSGVIFVEYKGRRNRVDKIEEQEVTSVILKVTREKAKIVYLVTGHGEGSLTDPRDVNGLSDLKNQLEVNSYQIKELPLAVKAEVPADADVVLVVGPQQAFIEIEVKALQNYLKRGGSLFLALDPKAPHGLDSLLQSAGVKVSNNYVVTAVNTEFGKMIEPSVTLGVDFSGTNSITKVFSRNGFALFQMPQGIENIAGTANVTFESIVKSGENSFAYADNKFQGEGLPGTYTLVGYSKGKVPEGTGEFQLVVAGDSDFLNHQLLLQNLNRDLFLNSILTLAKEENLVSITPKEAMRTELRLTENNFYLFIIAFVIPLPLLLIGTSGFLFYRRRNA